MTEGIVSGDGLRGRQRNSAECRLPRRGTALPAAVRRRHGDQRAQVLRVEHATGAACPRAKEVQLEELLEGQLEGQLEVLEPTQQTLEQGCLFRGLGLPLLG